MTITRLLFAISATVVLAAKSIHVYANSKAIPPEYLRLWGYSFFAQDFFLLSALRLLLSVPWINTWRPRNVAWVLRTLVASLLVAYTIVVSYISICFFVFAGSEIHYRNLDFAKDASARAVLFSGMLSAVVVALVVLVAAWVLQTPLYVVFGLPSDAAMLCWTLMSNCVRGRPPLAGIEDRNAEYSAISQSTVDGDDNLVKEKATGSYWTNNFLGRALRGNAIWYIGCLAAVGALLAEVGFLIFRPKEASLVYLSWTAPLLPFIDLDNSSPGLKKLSIVYNTGIGFSWDFISALGKPPHFSWLPDDAVLSGFEDWYGDKKKHYSAAADPMKGANHTLQELLPELVDHLRDVSIRHVVIVMLESTRKDVFPVKKDGLIWNRFAETFPDHTLSSAAAERLATLTRTANYVTGDYDDGFDHETTEARGGLSFNNAYTSSTYTLKSTIGTLCGIHPLIADFNLGYKHHVYQPCLPQIFQAFNALQNDSKPTDEDDFTSYSWRSSYMLSSTVNYDHTKPLLSAMGFPKDNVISKEYLKRPSAKFGKVDLPDVTYFGMVELPLEDYIRDAFVMAKKEKERVFITHLTSTSHHPYNMPENETYVPLGHKDALAEMSHYANAIGFDDRWLGKILQALEDEGVANETLVVLQGDHGISIPENDVAATYYNPNVGCDHVPLVFSHPKLPPLQIDSAVSTVQVLPTILDLLVETGSLSGKAKIAARDLVDNYESPPLARVPPSVSAPQPGNKGESSQKNQPQHTLGHWHFVVMNPGRAMIGIRDTRQKDWRMVVPVLNNIAWRFSNITSDPTEAHPIMSFSYKDFIRTVEKEHGIEAAKWSEEAAFISRWWVEENSKRWQYGPYSQ